MNDQRYAYSSRPTRNPLRFLLALWRVTRDPRDTGEAAIVEIGFARSRIGRRFARWGEVIDALRSDPRTASRLRERRLLGPIDLENLSQFPQGTLGRTFADHCRARGLNPNLVHVPPTGEVDWMLNDLYQTHDVWHVATGWGNDMTGEVGLAGFYISQLGGASFFAFLLALTMLNTVFFAPRTFAERMEALVAGYESGKKAEPLFGVNWADLWALPLSDVRSLLKLENSRIVGEGIRDAA